MQDGDKEDLSHTCSNASSCTQKRTLCWSCFFCKCGVRCAGNGTHGYGSHNVILLLITLEHAAHQPIAPPKRSALFFPCPSKQAARSPQQGPHTTINPWVSSAAAIAQQKSSPVVLQQTVEKNSGLSTWPTRDGVDGSQPKLPRTRARPTCWKNMLDDRSCMTLADSTG